MFAVLEDMINGAIAAKESGFLILVIVSVMGVDAGMIEAGNIIFRVLTLRVQVKFAESGAVI